MGGPAKREVYLEFILQSGLMKASAIDSLTGTEAVVFGPATTSREALGQAATAKLRYLLKKTNNE